MHDSNLFLPNTIDHARFVRMSHTFALRLNYLAQRCMKWEVLFDPVAAYDRSLYLLQCRLAAAKLASAEDALREPVPVPSVAQSRHVLPRRCRSFIGWS
jgi:hypothetical protein